MRITELIETEFKQMGSLYKLGSIVGIRYNTLLDYDKGDAKTFKAEHVEKLCKLFELDDFNQLFEIIPDETQA